MSLPYNKRPAALKGLGKLALAGLLACVSVDALAVPSFARQTNMPCSACHTVFPELTAFGRNFKLNGYTLTAAPEITQEAGNHSGGLAVDEDPPFSAMMQVGFTHLAKAEQDTQNNDVQFPQQLSLFYAGRFSDQLGAFMQLTYDQPSGAIGVDNVDVRYAKTTTVGGKALTYGATLNNAPTVQDLWNTLTAWGYPYLSSGSAPAPTAGSVMGLLAQDSTGLGAYALWDNTIYAELSLYRSSHQAQVKPDVTSDTAIQGAAPYARLTWQHAGESGDNLMLGLAGMKVDLMRPVLTGSITGPTDHYVDKVVDAQYEHPMSNNLWVVHASYTQEDQTLDASSPGFAPTLKTAKADISFHYGNEGTATLGYWSTKGDMGDYTNTYGYVGSPESRGWIAEVGYLPWQNTKFSLQYTAYNQFDGLPAGRKASDNNTTFLQAWMVW